ncbi:hypothetical protein PV783_11495 [Chitinophaga sp. CC14]|uniref:hypothetical protein n=1 Tax=Chitinophaga sp. CC14 TaxID=3029199 RepID=UPI003B7F996C
MYKFKRDSMQMVWDMVEVDHQTPRQVAAALGTSVERICEVYTEACKMVLEDERIALQQPSPLRMVK